MYVTSTKGWRGSGMPSGGCSPTSRSTTAGMWSARRLLDKPLLFWEDLMQQLFLDRLQVRWEVTGPAASWPVLPGATF